MLFKDLKKHLKAGKLSLAYTVFGDDAYVVRNAERLFLDNVVDAFPDFNITVFEKESDALQIIEACESLPMFSPVRLIIVREYLGDVDAIVEYLKNPCPSTVLVFVKPNPKEQFLKIFQRTEPVDCSKLDEESLKQFIAINVKKHGSSISNEAANQLLLYCNNDLSRISTELEKLCYYKLDGIIESSDVKDLVTADTEYKLFELSEAVSVKNNAKAADILKSLIEQKTPPVVLLGMLYSHFRRLLFCLVNKDDENLPQLLGIKEYAVKMSMRAAAHYTPVNLKRICDAFHAADFGFKTGKITDMLALELLVMQILGD